MRCLDSVVSILNLNYEFYGGVGPTLVAKSFSWQIWPRNGCPLSQHAPFFLELFGWSENDVIVDGRCLVVASCNPPRGLMADGSLTFNYYFFLLFLVEWWCVGLGPLICSNPILFINFQCKRKKNYKLCCVVATFLDQRIDITRVICNIFVESF